MTMRRASLLSLLFSCLLHVHGTSEDVVERKVYIVYTGEKHVHLGSDSSSVYMSMLQKVRGSTVGCGTQNLEVLESKAYQKANTSSTLGDSEEKDALLHIYHKSFSGFVAMLTEEEAENMKGLDDVASVFLSRKSEIQTTQSWDFMGFPQNVARANGESDVIIGVLDTGIWPSNPSFSDQGLGPPPSTWKGICQSITCNNKIIGARYHKVDGEFGPTDRQSPIDTNGHGTHVASTAAGIHVDGANLAGFCVGTARGGVPSARIAVYKVCWEESGCTDHDILEGFNHAIADGVDIISTSIGNRVREDYFTDAIAIGAFHAMRKGILTVASAGNNGPNLSSIFGNFSPWLLSVAAGTISRIFSTRVGLGNGRKFVGISINTFLDLNEYPLITGNARNASLWPSCSNNSLDENLVRGKIVFCAYTAGAHSELLRVGAAGAILISDNIPQDRVSRLNFDLPSSVLSSMDGNSILTYIRTAGVNATATIRRSKEEADPSAPKVASFSSRGPNPFRFGILKPDITAPGASILAAWTPLNPISQFKGDRRSSDFNILMGTSMACPHVSGAAAYVKSFHPTWSPAAIRSALMTTAREMNATLNPGAEFAYGAGFMEPTKALKPGLVYDLHESNYIEYLCGLNYSNAKVQAITSHPYNCSTTKSISYWDINYPTLTASSSTTNIDVTFRRTLTNVDSAASVYKYKIVVPPKLSIRVTPSVLRFVSLGQKLSYEVKVIGRVNNFTSTSLVWSDGTFQVRSPIVIYNE